MHMFTRFHLKMQWLISMTVLSTTAQHLLLALYAITQHPEVLKRLRDDINTLFATTGMPSSADVEGLPYLHNFTREVLRVYKCR
jgi:cytochrome P450